MNTRSALLFLAALTFGGLAARADEAFEPPVPVRTVAPKYPAEMKHDGIAGVVMVSCTIDETGSVQDAKVDKASNALFADPALDAVKKWKFKPARKAGSAVAIHIVLPIKFSVLSE